MNKSVKITKCPTAYAAECSGSNSPEERKVLGDRAAPFNPNWLFGNTHLRVTQDMKIEDILHG